MKYKASFFILILFITSCGYKNTRTNEVSFLPSELNNIRQLQDNKEVSVRGYLIHEPENYSVWDSRKAMKSGNVEKCISLLYASNVQSKIIHANRKYVYLTGVFKQNVIKENKVYLGLCNSTGIQVTDVLKSKKSPE